jgi:hypothetical protein
MIGFDVSRRIKKMLQQDITTVLQKSFKVRIFTETAKGNKSQTRLIPKKKSDDNSMYS